MNDKLYSRALELGILGPQAKGGMDRDLFIEAVRTASEAVGRDNPQRLALATAQIYEEWTSQQA